MTRVRNLMTLTGVTVPPTMLDHGFGALPVVDGGHLVGIITETDLLRAFVQTA